MLMLMSIIESLDTEEQKITAEQIFLNYKNAMFKIAYDVVDNEHDAEEVVEDTIIKICRHIDDFITKPENERKLLVKKYIFWTAIDRWRKNNRTRTESLNEEDYFDTRNTDSYSEMNDNVIFKGDDFGALQKYVSRLSEKYRTVLIFKFVHDFSNKKIAALLNIPESTVSTRLVRAQRQLQKMLNDEKEKKNGSDEKR